jgi:hypothetical protein
MRKLDIAGVIVFIMLIASAVRGQDVFIPAFDPVNDDIASLIDRGYLEDIRAAERPWLISEVINSILHDRPRFDAECAELASSILSRIKAPQELIAKRFFADFNLGVELRGLAKEEKGGHEIMRGRYIDRGFKEEYGSVYKAGWWISKDDRWGIDTRLIFDTDGTRYPWYYGTAHNGRTVGQFDHAYGFLNAGYFKIALGRLRMNWGPSPRGSLLLDSGSPPLDLAAAGFDLKPFRMTWFVSRLDDYRDPGSGQVSNRYLAGHRLSFKSSAGLELAASEIVLYSGPGRLPEPYYSIPILLYYWEAQNRRIDDNILWAIDGSYVVKRLGRFYLQFVADDIQYKSNGPQKFAVQAGTALAPSRFPGWTCMFEYNFVDTYVYGQRQRRNAYLNWGYPLARLDSDQFELFSGIYRQAGRKMKVGSEIIYREKGEYYADDTYPDPVPQDEKFPLGTVEETLDLALEISWNGYRKLYLDYKVGFQNLNNYKHQSGVDFDQFYTYLRISYSLDLGLPLWTKYH